MHIFKKFTLASTYDACVCGAKGYSGVYLKRLSDLLSLFQNVHREGQVSLFQSAMHVLATFSACLTFKKKHHMFFQSIVCLYLRAKLDENV